MKTVCIIGAGCSGLTAIKCCLEEKLIPVCYEQGEDIGGLWNYSDSVQSDRASIYRNLTINTSKEMMPFSDFPMPHHFPPFLPHQHVLEYFRMYAIQFSLMDHIQFHTTVVGVRKAPDHGITGRWQVIAVKAGAEPVTITFDAVMICSGHHSVPHCPDIKGSDVFEGKILHSHDYKHPIDLAEQRVLIVGIGNSAVDIAVDIARVAKKVMLSTRRGAWVIGRTGLWGMPNDLLANTRFLFSFPVTILQWLIQRVANLGVDHRAVGLRPKHGALEAHPTINDELPSLLLSGRVSIKPDIDILHEGQAEFTDNTREHVDTVVLATGYDYRVDFVDQDVLTIHNNHAQLYKFTFPTSLEHPTLCAIGLLQPIGAIMPISEMQCRWFTKVIKGEVRVPTGDAMRTEVRKRSSDLQAAYVKSRRHTLQTMWITYMDDIASEIGARPSIWRLLLTDPLLALRCFFGPCVPAQYRLQGPGRWQGASDVIRHAFRRSLSGMVTKINKKTQE